MSDIAWFQQLYRHGLTSSLVGETLVASHDLVIVAVLVLLALIMTFPDQYRRGMAKLCSVREDRFPAYPRPAAICLFAFFGLILLVDLIRYAGSR